MKVRAGEVDALAGAIVDAVVRQGFVRLKCEPGRVRQRTAALIAANLEEERALQEEAERLAESHARQMAGMDQRKIIQGIKERLARERGFPL